MLYRHSEADVVDENKEGWSKTLPKSWRETKLVTNVKERDGNDEVIKQRKQMVETMSPSRLSEIRGFSDFPVPQMFNKRSRSASETRKSKEARRDSNSETRSIGGNSSKFGTLSKTKLITKIKVTQDPEKLANRRTMTETQTPAQLSNISGLGDFPLPSTLENFLKGGDKKPKKVSEEEDRYTYKLIGRIKLPLQHLH